MEHTNEPWAYEIDHDNEREWKVTSGVYFVAICPDAPGPGNETPEANARRIVACVNACAGIQTAELEYVASDDREKGVGLIRNIWDSVHLRQQRDELLSALERAIADCNINFPEDAKSNARRIVACVNACAGIETEELENIFKAGKNIGEYVVVSAFQSMEKQRNELLAALERVLLDVPINGQDEWEIQARAAIASVKGL